MSLTGQQIYDLLNQQWPPYQPYDRLLQISGLTYTWDNSLPADNRTVQVRKGGVAIDKGATYSVVVNNYLADGGDKFSVLKLGTNREVGPSDLDALVAHIPILTQPFNATIEGRITRLN